MRVLLFIGYTLGAGLLMSLFILVPGLTRFIFSLGALLVGVRFFRAFEKNGARIGFITAGVVISLLFTVIYVALALVKGWPINPQFKG